MDEEIRKKLDRWFGGEYDVLHYWEDESQVCHVTAIFYGTIYFVRVWKWMGEIRLSQDHIRVLYHHDDYEVIDGRKFVMLAGGR
jgi:uncharacterized protein involved in response to NO